MHTLWKRILTETSELLPDFNDYLLLEFRKEKIGQIRNYLDTLFQEIVKVFNGRLVYLGWEEMTPDERLEYIKTNKIINKRVSIQDSTFELLRFKFELDGERYPVYIHIPYTEGNAIIYNGTHYFPMFPIIERGGLHRTGKDVIIKVMRCPIMCKRTISSSFTTTDADRAYQETVITVKIHQRQNGRGGKNAVRTPLILYHLVNNSFPDTARMYGFLPGEIGFSGEDFSDDKMASIRVSDSVYIRITRNVLEDQNKRRFIASLLLCFKEYPKFDLTDLRLNDIHYFRTVLGKFTYQASSNGALLYENAVKHLETTDTLLDAPAAYQLAQIGIHASNIYELLLIVFYNLDNWIVGYDPIDLYEKKIGSLEQIMASAVSTINNKMFDIINNKRKGLESSTLANFTKSISLHPDWITKSSCFRINPSIYNDNWLIGIGASRYRSLENTETKNIKKSNHKVPKNLLLAHPSQLVVESILVNPPSAPIVTGTINPYLQIDHDGNIIRPPWADEIAHVFD